jgi:hypothetical protein
MPAPCTPLFSIARRVARLPWRMLLVPLGALGLTNCASTKTSTSADVVVSVKDQKIGLYRDGHLAKTYGVSTSKFGVGDKPGSNCTPLGKHEVIAKIGYGLPKGAVLHSRQWNGEVLKPNAPGRDPIVSRILWLSGMERGNRNAYNRFIYIHGTAEESRIGTPASYGCVRMRSADIVSVFDKVNIGSTVLITKDTLPSEVGTETKSRAVSPALSEPLDVTDHLATATTSGTSSVTMTPEIQSAVRTHSSTPRAVQMTITADGRVVPADSAKDTARKPGERVKGVPQSNGRQGLKLPVAG